MKRIAWTTLGCKVNLQDTLELEDASRRAGFEAVPFEHQADVYVVNTCTVTHLADREARRLARAARRRNPDARVVMTGCYATVSPAALEAMPEVDLVVGNQDKATLLTRLAGLEGSPGTAPLGRPPRRPPLAATTARGPRARPVLRIQDGCDHRCSFCVIPRARGASRSVPPAVLVASLAGLAADDVPEVVLSGVHLAGYGRELRPRTDLARLLQAAAALPGVPRLRLSSIEPVDMGPEVVALLEAHPEVFCRHLHMAVQSGSTRVLAAMGRRYTREAFMDRAHDLLRRLPGLAVTLDLLVGFPGETEADHRESLSLVQDLPVADLHVFPYSPRPGTPAASLPGAVPPAILRRRARELRRLGRRQRQAYQVSQVGREVSAVVVEELEVAGRPWRRCLTDTWVPVHVPGREVAHGDGVRVVLEEPDPAMPRGRLLALERRPRRGPLVV